MLMERCNTLVLVLLDFHIFKFSKKLGNFFFKFWPFLHVAWPNHMTLLLLIKLNSLQLQLPSGNICPWWLTKGQTFTKGQPRPPDVQAAYPTFQNQLICIIWQDDLRDPLQSLSKCKLQNKGVTWSSNRSCSIHTIQYCLAKLIG